MILTSPRSALTRTEAAQALSLAPAVIDALIDSGALLCRVTGGREEGIPIDQLERLLRDSLLRLYHAEAVAAAAKKIVPQAAPQPADDASDEVTIAPIAEPAEPPRPELSAESAAAEDDDAPVITRSIAEHQAAEQERPDLRIAPRYIPRKQINGSINHVRFSILQISTTGLRIRHEETLRPGDEARVTFALMNPAQSFPIRCRVVWTSIAQRGDGPSFCISGLRVIDNADRLRRAVDLLRDARELVADRHVRRSNALPVPTPPALTGVSDDDVASIIRAVRRFAGDPVEAGRWYARARFSLSEEHVRANAPQRARDREEVLGIWEYLDRKIEIPVVANVVSWMRRTRATATVDS